VVLASTVPFCITRNPKADHSIFAEFEVFTEVVMKSIIFWDMTLCSPSSFNRRFEEHIASIFRVEEIIPAGGKYSACHLLASWFLLNLFLRP
jgi:hypothetical protein